MFCFILISDAYDVVTCLGGFDIGNLPTGCLPELVKMAKPGKWAFNYIFHVHYIQWWHQHLFYFLGGGGLEEGKREARLCCRGVKNLKDINFDHFVQENHHFSWFHSFFGGAGGEARG